MTQARLLYGGPIAAGLRSQVKRGVADFSRRYGFRPVLTAVKVGRQRASSVYVNQILRTSELVGVPTRVLDDAAGVGRLQTYTSSSSVVLPQPLGPTTATISPAPTSRSRPSSARTAPKSAAHARQACRTAPINVSRLLRRSLELGRHRSLRGHYPQVRRVSAGHVGAISAGLRQPPCWSVMDASAGARRRASPLG